MSGSVSTGAAAPVASVKALLRGVVDYAGLFPPAALPMAAAVQEYAEHRNGEHAWALGRFVVPAARLDEFESASGANVPRQAYQSWALSALLGSDLEEDIERIERFNDRHRDARHGAVLVDTVELKTGAPRDVAHAADLLDRRFDTYMEVPVPGDADTLLVAIADTKAKAKIRTGGVTREAFPASAHVVRFIAGCVAHGVAFKATAGLHHPWRNEYPLTYAPDAACGSMFGFLNVLLAAAALRSGWTEADATSLLEERDGGRVRFESDRVVWRDRTLPVAEIQRARDTMTAFGSCSFRDPVRGLQASTLL